MFELDVKDQGLLNLLRNNARISYVFKKEKKVSIFTPKPEILIHKTRRNKLINECT